MIGHHVKRGEGHEVGDHFFVQKRGTSGPTEVVLLCSGTSTWLENTGFIGDVPMFLSNPSFIGDVPLPHLITRG